MIQRLLSQVNGNKTYSTALIAFLYGAYVLVTGDTTATWADPGASGTEGATSMVLGGGMASLRHAIAKLHATMEQNGASK